MAIRQIFKNDAECLYKKSRPVERFDKKLSDLIDDMADTMYEADGVGLAAPQVGILRRVFVIDCGDEIAKAFKSKKAQAVSCSRLDDVEILSEIDELCKKPPQIKIDRDAAVELISRTQGSMARIAIEIAKLKSYSNGTITKIDVCEMVSADIDFQIYELANAVSEKNAAKALEVLDVFFKNGIRGVTIINRLYDKYRNMLHAELNKGLSNDDLAKLLGMKSGAVYFLRKVSSNYSQMRLKRCVDYLHALQFDVLTGKRGDVSAIHEAILQLLVI